MSARRYVTIIQDPRGYPEPGEYEDDLTTVTMHEVVLRDDYETLLAERDEWQMLAVQALDRADSALAGDTETADDLRARAVALAKSRNEAAG